MQLYGRAGMVVQTVLMDMEFDKTVDELSDQTVVNTSAARDHVAEIQRQTIRPQRSAAMLLPALFCLKFS